jgi:hypothetical protein
MSKHPADEATVANLSNTMNTSKVSAHSRPNLQRRRSLNESNLKGLIKKSSIENFLNHIEEEK